MVFPNAALPARRGASSIALRAGELSLLPIFASIAESSKEPSLGFIAFADP